MSGRGSKEQEQGPDRITETQTPRARPGRAQAPGHGAEEGGQGGPGARGGEGATGGGGEREVQGGGQGRALQEFAGERKSNSLL